MLTASPLTVSVSLSPELRTVVISQSDAQHPVCPVLAGQATLTR
ncbi:hypothetical protein [Streptomyces sp. YIM S03343]